MGHAALALWKPMAGTTSSQCKCSRDDMRLYLQVLVTDLHAKVAEAHARQQAAQDALHTAELNVQKEAATRAVLETTLQRSHRELADANQERCKQVF